MLVKFLKQQKSDNLIKTFTNRLHIDKEFLLWRVRYKVHKLIFIKKKVFFEKKLNEFIAKLKEIWKALKSLDLPNKSLSCEVSALRVSKTVQHYTNLILGINFNFKDYFSKIAKAAGLDNLSGRFLKNGTKVLLKPIIYLCNLSITSIKFSDSCNIAKLKPTHKKSSVTEASHHRPISLLLLISKVIKKVIHCQTIVFLKFFMQLLILFSQILHILFNWQNPKGFWQRFDNWHDTD